LFWHKKILPKWWAVIESAAAKDEAKKCPFLKPHSVIVGLGTKSVERECLQERCEICDEREGRCSIPVANKLLRELGQGRGNP